VFVCLDTSNNETRVEEKKREKNLTELFMFCESPGQHLVVRDERENQLNYYGATKVRESNVPRL
jgi:hypothetical protein